jgi:hypothetical protein
MTTLSLKVAMDDILDAMTTAENEALRAYLDVETGAVEIVTEGDLALTGEDSDADEDPTSAAIEENPERYREIPKYEARAEHDLMCRFADSVQEPDIEELLDVALRGKGAFGRFRDVVFRHADLKTEWLTLRQETLLNGAKRWLRSLGIEPVYKLRPIDGGAAATEQHARPRATIDLLELLLLGAPDGKAELVEGQVLRRFSARTKDQARATFKSLARDLCGYYGLPWRKRHVEGRSTFDIERAHLGVVDRVVELRVDISPTTWKSFTS